MSFQTAVRRVFKSVVFVAFLVSLVAAFQPRSSHAQDTIGRKVRSKVSPIYPDIAKKMNLAGVVKIEVVIAPSGSVKETKVIGGNPILVNAALDAVKKWRFEAASDETTGVLEFKFDPTVN